MGCVLALLTMSSSHQTEEEDSTPTFPTRILDQKSRWDFWASYQLAGSTAGMLVVAVWTSNGDDVGREPTSCPVCAPKIYGEQTQPKGLCSKGLFFFFFLFFCPINLEYPLLSKVSLCSVWTHYIQSWKWCLSFGEHSSLELFLLEHLEKISNMTS